MSALKLWGFLATLAAVILGSFATGAAVVKVVNMQKETVQQDAGGPGLPGPVAGARANPVDVPAAARGTSATVTQDRETPAARAATAAPPDLAADASLPLATAEDTAQAAGAALAEPLAQPATEPLPPDDWSWSGWTGGFTTDLGGGEDEDDDDFGKPSKKKKKKGDDEWEGEDDD